MKTRRGSALPLLSLVLSCIALTVSTASILDFFPDSEQIELDSPKERRANLVFEIGSVEMRPAAPPESSNVESKLEGLLGDEANKDLDRAAGSIGENLNVDAYFERTKRRDTVEIGETLDVATYVRPDSGDTVDIGPNLLVEEY
jgi:hypothetical protein